MENYLEKAKRVLSPLELEYFMIMWGRNGTLFIQGHPGGAKSAILHAIASKMGALFIPMWAPAMDEMDVGLYPHLTTHEGTPCVDYVPPKWALEANGFSGPVIVVFEEFNRNDKLMNATLSITNERKIAHRITFGENVMFAVTGNLGDEDGTSVDILDTAQSGRMIVCRHSMEGNDGLEYWKENFAAIKGPKYPNGRIHSDILAYLNYKPSDFRPIRSGSKNDGGLQVDARRWTQLSDFIFENFGPNATFAEYGHMVTKVGTRYIGNLAPAFIQYITENVRPTLEDVLKKGGVKILNRDNQAEILKEATDLETNAGDEKSWLESLKAKEFENFVAFLKVCDDDARAGVVVDLWWQIQLKYKKKATNAIKLNDIFPDIAKYFLQKDAEAAKLEEKK